MIKKNKIIIGLVLILLILATGACSFTSYTNKTQIKNQSYNPDTPAMVGKKTNWESVEQVIGKSGEIKKGDVLYFSLPRTDLHVSINSIQLNPAFALSSWLAFKEMNDKVMVMGDLVLTQEEVNLVMTELIRGGIKITALHNHLMRESPKIMYMHIEGYGSGVALAKALRAGIDQSSTPIKPDQPSVKGAFLLDKEQLDDFIGKEGLISNGIYKVGFPRAEQIKENGMTIPPSMGTSTAINFQPTGEGNAAITGDFVLTAKEVNPVIQTLRKYGIEVDALHNHMLFEEPRLFFIHFWANDDALKLAKGIREAIDQTNSK
ncbi:DUF1259 domain-containing protein [Cytobacillus dafuensis]|nr:DUF1259 domain-containing protein [Cytobacillus dafuensis]